MSCQYCGEDDCGSSAGGPDMCKRNPFKSYCCGADIINGKYQAHCGQCQTMIYWAFFNERWARREACAVFEGLDGKKYFAWQQTSNLEHAKELFDRGDPFVCFTSGRVHSITAELNRDGDMIERCSHISFIRQWAKEVENPEMGKRIYGNY